MRVSMNLKSLRCCSNLAYSLLVLSIAAIASGEPHGHRLIVRSSWDAIPAGYTRVGPLSASDTVRLMIAMPQNNVPGLHAAVLDVSDPGSKNYGKPLSKAEVERLVAPNPESVAAVTDWLDQNGISPSSGSPSGDMLTIHVPVEKANSLLAANFTSFVHDETRTLMVRTLAYSLPETVADHISFIYPTTHFIPPSNLAPSFKIVDPKLTQEKGKESKRGDVPQTCAESVTPRCLQGLYNIPSKPATATNNNLFVAAVANEVPRPDDVLLFLAEQRPDITNPPNPPFSFVSVDGAGTPNFDQATLELSIDADYSIGLATNVPVTIVSAAGNFPNSVQLEQFVEMTNFLLARDTVPLVLSASFVFNERVDLPAFLEIAPLLCNAFAQLGARGTSVLFCSGDNGVAGFNFQTPFCNGDSFMPTFPGVCPFVTSVGSTAGIPETAAAFSSGGFSNVFPRPSYQDTAVQKYLSALGSTNAGKFNTTGRGFPDVSTLGQNFPIKLNGRDDLVFGTSASTPTFASMIALLNDRLLNAGKSPLGFLNPLLYQNADAFNDITNGSNPGKTPGTCSGEGFPAKEGWDPVTGLGTPDFNKLAALLSVPGSTPTPTQPQSTVPQKTQIASTLSINSQSDNQTQAASPTAQGNPGGNQNQSSSAITNPNIFATVVRVLRVLVGWSESPTRLTQGRMYV